MSEASARPLHILSATRTLSNGMRIVVHEDRAAPVVAVHLMYAAGSRHERPGTTGLAHLLEHLMFEGSQHAPKGTFDDLLERVGGTNNGSTWLDRTNYYETVPSHAVELALWLERDRMANFAPVLSAEMIETQRGVVINERRQSYENRPYGLADERLHQLLFPPEHPYSWPTIGYIADLERITLADVRHFLDTFYVPNNAVLAFAGDIDADAALALAEKYFGDLAAGPELPADRTAVPARAGARDEIDDAVSFPRLYRAFAVPPYGTADWVALDVLAYLLGDGESARLQRALVRDGQLAQDVDTFLYPTACSGVFGMVATARSGVEIERIEAALEAVLRSVVEEGVSEDELRGAVRRVRRDQIGELASVEERADALAHAATLLGDADALNTVFARYDDVTADDLRRVARTWLQPEHGATLIVHPRDEADDEG